MSQVSKRYLAKAVQERMYDILIKAVGKASDADTVIHFLTDLLSPTERIMFAKRLAIAYLLLKNMYTQREIVDILKVSLTTVHKVSVTLSIRGSGYRSVIAGLMREEQVEAFMKKLGDLLTSVPPKGRNWSQWRVEREAEKRSRRKAF